ncbi:PQ loop repeat-domain-containing protein [Rhodofomes roseus]|uniref:PQ loop repeat-domain-containing protein n=1 Tax=Rhodofomes roseus TaxID=34475 RepID=A0ABQ8KVG3_9APHY|nr:PQ loop repeat-domain-containing protein [Rhodofomes roseus]KAH9843067.1 PQ loop repeat-domain-containing protein [Rhodofomes roseus]
MFGSSSLSDVLGWASIASWLGAQFPQVIENIRRQSADGLALPFLLNWALGDATNLIGCILTHQLPFQTWLATYFCFVDFSLLSQYFYYRYKSASKQPPYLSIRSRTTSTATTHRLPTEREATHYRALSNVAANVAAAAARVAEQEEHARWHRNSLERIPHSAVEARELLAEEEDDVDEEGLARLADSFHSEGGRPGRRKKVSWSQERGGSVGRHGQGTTSPPGRIHAPLHMSAAPQVEEPDLLVRGRSLSRDVSTEEEAQWSASQRRSSRASRKGASMVFLGGWALFGVGTLLNGQQGFPSTTALGRTGHVLPRADATLPTFGEGIPAVYDNAHAPSVDIDPTAMFERAAEPTDYTATTKQPERSTEFIIGRISAWICTTLYLTSRLPQIWKNFVRKSVEGLSIYLFIFAFLGNFFYVASILTSPKLGLPEPEASAFIKESIPYLLGSGGTLVFDITIVAQSLIYRQKTYRGRRSSRSLAAEEEGLLSAGATGTEDVTTPSRRRAGVSADSTAL